MNKWDVQTEEWRVHSRRSGGHICVKENIKDTKRLALRKGDIVKFPNGFRNNSDYREWFLTKRDKEKYLPLIPHIGIPKYAMNQYAIVVSRYIISKYKYMTFRDYGCLLMLLTGNKIGKIKTYYGRSPFNIISKYPHKKIENFYVRLKKPFKVTNKNLILGNHNISKSLSEITALHGNNEEGRDLFLSQLYIILESEELI